MKEKFKNFFTVTGALSIHAVITILWFVIFLYPIYYLPLPWWATLIIFYVVVFLLSDWFSILIQTALWIWSVIHSLSQPLGPFEIALYILCGIHTILFVIKTIRYFIEKTSINTPTSNTSEAVYLMERDDGIIVRVPASKLGEFDPSKTEPTQEEAKFAADMATRLMEKYGKKSESTEDPTPPAPVKEPDPAPTKEPFDLDAFLADCKNDLI